MNVEAPEFNLQHLSTLATERNESPTNVPAIDASITSHEVVGAVVVGGKVVGSLVGALLGRSVGASVGFDVVGDSVGFKVGFEVVGNDVGE